MFYMHYIEQFYMHYIMATSGLSVKAL